jgi:hypothetical protein
MTRTRTLVCIGLAVVAFALFGGSATVGQDDIGLMSRQNERGIVPQAVEPTDAVSNLSREVARLRERLERAPVQQNISRNPFLFITEEPEVEPVLSRRATQAIPDASGEDITMSTNGHPDFSFIGVAQDVDQRTAILLMGDGQVVVVGVGDAVADQYRVGNIEENAVTIFDSNGILRRYELR